jgi:hypothetical protein
VTIVSIAAPGNGSGKTMTLAAILQAFPGRFSVVKFTTVFKDGVNCPRTEKACACRSLHGRYTVVTDPGVIAMEDTDTGRLVRAGGSPVLWCLALAGAHDEAWDHIRRDLLPAGASVLTEGNTVVPILAPDLLVMVASPRLPKDRWKPDAHDLMRRADVVVVNRHGCSPESIAALADEITAVRGGRPPAVEDVVLPLASWRDATLREQVARVLGAAA